MEQLGRPMQGVYLTGARSREVEVVRVWAKERGLNCAWLSQQDAVEREVDTEATLVVVDASENLLDAIAQTARIRAAHREVPALLLGLGQQQKQSFLRAAARSGARGEATNAFPKIHSR